MIRSSSAPDTTLPLKQPRAGQAASPVQPSTKRIAKGSPLLGRAGGEVLLPKSVGGCYLLGGDLPGERARLTHFAPLELWGRHSSRNIVQDLYAGYAADPLAPGPRKQMIPSASSSGASTPMGQAGEISPSRPCFLERYVRQQAHIEQLLNEWKPPVVLLAIDDNDGQEKDNHEKAAAKEVEAGIQAVDRFTFFDQPPALQVATKTRNVTLQGDIIACSGSCGGVRFSPPEEDSFRLCVRLLDPPETHPIYIGMVPAGVVGSEVSFLSDRTDGIFLRLGGYPTAREAVEGPPLGETDPLKPMFSVFGERLEASLPLPKPGVGVALHFYEAFTRHITTTVKIQCTGCKKLLDSTEQFAEHCFDDAEGHSYDFGFDSCRRVEVVEEGDYNLDPGHSKKIVRFQVENEVYGSQAQAFCDEPRVKSLSDGVPSLPRELPELVGGRAQFGPPGPWQACILLCTPGTRVQACWMPTGFPTKPPQPPKIRPAPADSRRKKVGASKRLGH